MSAITHAIPNAQTINRTVLANDVTVLVYENHAAQSVVIAGSVRVGSVYESAAHNGLASLTASALMRGTQNRDFETIHTTLEDAGADVSVRAGTFRTSFSGKSLAEDLELLVDVTADVLRHPTYPSTQIERLRGELITGLHIRQQDTRYRANRAFSEALYPDNHPFHYSVSGTLETVPTLRRDDLTAFHAQHYGPAGMIIVVVGAVDTDAAVEIVGRHFADWQNPNQPANPELPALTPLPETVRNVVTLPGKTQSDVVMGVPGPSRYADDYQAAVLANSVLGQFGMMGRVGAKIREELGLAYYAYSSVAGGSGPGPWQVSAGINPKNVDLTIARVTDELRRLVTEPVSDEDLEDNQSYYVGRLPLQLESNEGIAGTILSMETYDLGLDYLANYRDLIFGLTKDDLMAAAQRYLNPDALVIGLAGPEMVSS
ncbi:MAG: insulinase family protein [Chloroflexi bacterium]|nr:insulinase family protein [Chloroflexota bacterium]